MRDSDSRRRAQGIGLTGSDAGRVHGGDRLSPQASDAFLVTAGFIQVNRTGAAGMPAGWPSNFAHPAHHIVLQEALNPREVRPSN